MYRYCEEKFLFGHSWETVKGDCHAPEHSTLTPAKAYTHTTEGKLKTENFNSRCDSDSPCLHSALCPHTEQKIKWKNYENSREKKEFKKIKLTQLF